MERSARFPFLAAAEVSSDDWVEFTRVTELSRYGCYLETAKHRTPGARVTIKIVNKGRTFEATATVLYSRPTMGMGIAFREVKPIFQSILEEWIQQSLSQQNQRPSIDNWKSSSIPSGAFMIQKPRRSPRIPFIAVAEAAYKDSGGRVSCQVTTLSLHGCYVETPSTLLIGREVSIKIFAESECFVATAKVVYELPNAAMGVAFEEVPLKSQAILRQWLQKASGGPERL